MPAQPIKLEYSTDGGTSWAAIVTATENDGTFAWTVPALNTLAGKIRLTATDQAGNALSSLSTGVFIVDSTVPTLTPTYAGAGGTIPQDGKKINSSGIDISGTSFDTHIANIAYLFRNTTIGQYWNGASYTATPTWVAFCTDAQSLGNAGTCNNIADTGSLAPTVVNGNNYTFQLRALDEAGNSTLSNQIGYVGDTVSPTLAITAADNQYMDNSMAFSGTASDAGSSISSVQVQITKYLGGTLYYWNGTAWVTSVQSLPATTTDSYAHWSYNLSLVGDVDGQAYTGKVIAYDQAFKINNNAESLIHFARDTSAPAVASDVFTFTTSGYHSDGETFQITWDPSKVTATGAVLASSPISLFYNIGAGPVAIT